MRSLSEHPILHAVLAMAIFVLLASQAMMAADSSGAGASSRAAAPHLAVSLVSEKNAITPGSDIWLGFHFQLDPGWHIYWTNPGDSGEPPRVQWTLPAGFTAGAIEWPYPDRITAPSLVDYGYNGSVLLMAPLHAGSDVPAHAVDVAANLRWLVCREICVPGRADLHLALPVATSSSSVGSSDPQTQQLFSSTRARIPQPAPNTWNPSIQSEKDHFVLSLENLPAQATEFFPLQPEQIDNVAPQVWHNSSQTSLLELKKSDQLLQEIPALQGVVVLRSGEAYTVNAVASGAPAVAGSSGRIWTMLGFAFAGGLILNLMPCVFPVLSLKAVGLMNATGEDRKSSRRQGLLYGLGVLVCFWLLVGSLLGLREAGRQIGWGFQLQSPFFVVILAALLFLLGLSLAGVFDIGMSWMGLGNSLASRSGSAGSFFTGVLATIVATPCTAPFMGSAIGFAVAEPPPVAFAIFTALAIGLAFPFVLLAWFPHWARVLPKPGRWMELFKQAMSFPLFGAVVWLLWVFGQQAGIGALVRMLFSLLLIAVGAWVLGRFRRSAVAVPVLVLFAVAVWFPLSASRQTENSTASISDGLRWEPFSTSRVEQYRAEGKPVFVDFTAAWCLSCQVNERAVFGSPEVKQKLQNTGLVLLRADWTSYDPTITKTLAAFGRSGVPFYLLYGKEPGAQPTQLPELLTPRIFLNALNHLD